MIYLMVIEITFADQIKVGIEERMLEPQVVVTEIITDIEAEEIHIGEMAAIL